MAQTSKHHHELTDGVGKCSVPMWCQGLPAGFCDQPAYGKPEPDQCRYGGWDRNQRRWIPRYVPGLACYVHGGPQESKPSEIGEEGR